MIGLDIGDHPPGKRSVFKKLGGVIAALYHSEWENWTSHYRRYFTIAARILAVGFILGFLVVMIRPDLQTKALIIILRQLKDISLQAPPPVLALSIFYHNALASAGAVLMGLLPFFCVSALDPLLNGAALGFLTWTAKAHGHNVFMMLLTRVAPHGIIELPAVLYATSIGLHISLSAGKKIVAVVRRRSRKGQEPADPGGFIESYAAVSSAEPDLLAVAGDSLRSFLLVVLPLLLVAAFVEAFVTPHLG